jgi:hypothetical protein
LQVFEKLYESPENTNVIGDHGKSSCKFLEPGLCRGNRRVKLFPKVPHQITEHIQRFNLKSAPSIAARVICG